MAEASPILEAKGLACGYHGRAVLTGLDLKLEPGQIKALLGPNGSGKSTLLKTLCKTLPTIAGSVILNGQDLAALTYSELALEVAYVPQDEHIVFPFTVREVTMMGRLSRSKGLLDSLEDVQVALDAMTEADCLQFAERSVLELSGGELQRVWIARAIAQSAPVLLLDEPTSHLDAGHVLGLVDLLKNLAGRGYAILVAVHDLNVASLLAESAVLLNKGRVASEGPCDKVLASEHLEQVYGVQFSRLIDEAGVLRVFPTSKTYTSRYKP